MSLYSEAFSVEKGDFVTAGEASAKIKRTLKKLGVNSSVIRRVAVSSYEVELNLIIHSLGGQIDFTVTQDDVMLRDFSRLLNRLSGMADEMSSYFRRMKVEKEFEEVLLGEDKEDKEAKLLASMRELLGKEER